MKYIIDIIDIIKFVISLIFNRQADKLEQPKEIHDAKTPENISSGWNKYLDDKLRDKTRDSH